MSPVKRYDLHIHSIYSRDSNLKPIKILKLAKKRGLDGIAVTDHNSIKGGLITKRENKDKEFEVIIGSEIRTRQAEVLALYLQEEIKSDNLLEVLEKIREQGGVSIIAHPFAFLRQGLSYPIEKLKNNLNGIECLNGRAIFPYENKKAHQVAAKYNLAVTAGSDAHFSFEIGRAYTLFNNELCSAIRAKKTRLEGSTIYSKLGRLYSIPYKLFRLFY